MASQPRAAPPSPLQPSLLEQFPHSPGGHRDGSMWDNAQPAGLRTTPGFLDDAPPRRVLNAPRAQCPQTFLLAARECLFASPQL